MEETGDQTKTVIASTASPFMFGRSVLNAIDSKYDTLSDFEQIDELAKIANVSRQVIVNDMTLLKARNEPILATSQGYLYIVKEGNEQNEL